jgi:glycosyltransferase involved in cell wall biosynthesis
MDGGVLAFVIAMEVRSRDREERSSLDEWRQEGHATLATNLENFRALVARSGDCIDRGDDEQAAVHASIAAYHAQWRHCGLFFSAELEALLARLGGVSPVRRRSRGMSLPRSVLHVSTNVSIISGIPRLIRRWMQLDAARQHSLALTQQPNPVPDDLVTTVRDRGGDIHVLNRYPGGHIARGRRLRRLARRYDLVVLHTWEPDVVPTIAFGSGDRPPVVYVNHGDHCFWLGTTVADVVANLRESGHRLSLARRRISVERNLLLPTPIDAVERRLTREEAKRALGIPPDRVLLISIARAPKYMTLDGVTFADAHVPLLRAHPNAMLWVVGPGTREDWGRAIAATNGRIVSMAQTSDTSTLYQAADIYVDSFPCGSTTSLLEAARYGVPVATRLLFSGASAILGTDMPGLDGHMVVTRDLDDYTAAMSRLVRDERSRRALGSATCDSVLSRQSGDGWRRQLEDLYARAAAVSPVHSAGSESDAASFGEPDVYLPRIHSSSYDLDWFTELNLGATPLVPRFQQWRRLGRQRGSRLPYRALLPEWVALLYGRILAASAAAPAH